MTSPPSPVPGPLVWDPPPTPCTYRFPLPWAGEDQMDRCRCDLDKGHKGEHECRHTRAETKP